MMIKIKTMSGNTVAIRGEDIWSILGEYGEYRSFESVVYLRNGGKIESPQPLSFILQMMEDEK